MNSNLTTLHSQISGILQRTEITLDAGICKRNTPIVDSVIFVAVWVYLSMGIMMILNITQGLVVILLEVVGNFIETVNNRVWKGDKVFKNHLQNCGW